MMDPVIIIISEAENNLKNVTNRDRPILTSVHKELHIVTGPSGGLG